MLNEREREIPAWKHSNVEQKARGSSRLYINTKPISVFSIIIKIAVYGRNISQLYCTKRPTRSRIWSRYFWLLLGGNAATPKFWHRNRI